MFDEDDLKRGLEETYNSRWKAKYRMDGVDIYAEHLKVLEKTSELSKMRRDIVEARIHMAQQWLMDHKEEEEASADVQEV